MNALRLVRVSAICIALLSLWGATYAGNRVVVEGIVTSPESNQKEPIPGVIVRADRAGRVVAQTKTTPDGSYKLEVDEGHAFDVVYDHTQWHPDTLKRLSGIKNHTVNKVLYRPGKEQDYAAEVVHNILVSYEYVHFLGIVGGVSITTLRERYGGRLLAIKPTKFPEDIGRLLDAKRHHVLALYGMR